MSDFFFFAFFLKYSNINGIVIATASLRDLTFPWSNAITFYHAVCHAANKC